MQKQKLWKMCLVSDVVPTMAPPPLRSKLITTEDEYKKSSGQEDKGKVTSKNIKT